MTKYLFAFVSSVAFYTIAIKIPKRMTRLEIYCTSLFSLLVNILADVYLDMRMHLYTYFEPGIDFIVPFYFLGVFPPISTIFLNYFPFSSRLFQRGAYIFGWSTFAILYEYLATRVHVLTYTGWHLWYSACVYPPVQIMHALNLFMIRRYLCKQETRPNADG